MTATFSVHTALGSALAWTRFCITHRTNLDVCAAVWRSFVRRFDGAVQHGNHRSIAQKSHQQAAFVWSVRPVPCRRKDATALFSTDRSPSYFSMWWRGFGGRSRDGQVRWRDKSPHIVGRAGRGFAREGRQETHGAAFAHTVHIFKFLHVFRILGRCQEFRHE